jgi:hypothetical protein
MPKKSAILVVGWLLTLSFVDPVVSSARTWDFLGFARIDTTGDHQKIRVTRRGLFSSIQLRLSGETVFFDRVVIHFHNGTSKDVAVKNCIAPSARNVFDFGERRGVESIELWYFKQRWEHDPIVIVYGS